VLATVEFRRWHRLEPRMGVRCACHGGGPEPPCSCAFHLV